VEEVLTKWRDCQEVEEWHRISELAARRKMNSAVLRRK